MSTLLRAILVAAVVPATRIHGKTCVHDAVQTKHLVGYQDYEQHPYSFSLKTRKLNQQTENATATYQSLRITPYYDNSSMSTLTAEQTMFLKNKLVPQAVDMWQKTLSVIRVQGNLKAKRQCNRVWNLNPPVCSSTVPQQKCFDMIIPEDHFGETRVCSTCTNSDGCKGDSCTIKKGNGIANTDFVLYIHAEKTQFCKSKVLAYASSCQRDQYDRPTFGFVNFCPNQLDLSPKEFDSQLNTAMHELSHALGFTSDMFPYMRDQNGVPRTLRDNNGEPPRKNHVCANGVAVRNYAHPSNTTVKFFKERGHYVAKMVTPNVLKYVRDHFGCASLNGAELEGQEGTCIGSHWEERVFENEFMSAIQSAHNVISGLSLAFFEDSGWYKANHSMAQPLYWGAKRGCKFAMEKCIDPLTQESIADDHFCTTASETGCTLDGHSKAVCSKTSRVPTSIPVYFRYFGNAFTGGDSSYMDYCPIYKEYAQGSCADPANLFTPPGTNLNVRGETFCKSCRCTKSTLHSKEASEWEVLNQKAGCYNITCAAGTVSIKVPKANNTFATVTCDQKGEEIEVPGFTGKLYCPDPYVMCNEGHCQQNCGPNALCSGGSCTCLSGYVPKVNGTGCVSACPDACSQRGRCKVATGECSCNDGWKGENCATPIPITTMTQNKKSAAGVSQYLLNTSIQFLLPVLLGWFIVRQ